MFTIALITLQLLDTSPLEDLSDFLVETVLGNAVVATIGLSTILLSIGLLLSWLNAQKWKDLRYKMAFYLYHSINIHHYLQKGEIRSTSGFDFLK